MSIHKLYLFAKDTDAPATEQGFQYQKLKTLKTWLENRINQADETIYCDYEEDIFQRDFEKGKSKFRQVKLYSSNFSFSKEEVTKSLAHFFMLFVKEDYSADEVSFVFETNSNVARAYGENDADLLREWAANYGKLSEELQQRCRERVKTIIDEYVEKAISAATSQKRIEEFREAKEIYDQLTEETWNKFISSIEWQFDAIPQEEALPLLLSEIEDLVLQLPLPVDSKKVSTYISVLHYEITQRTGKIAPEESALTNQLLDFLILNEGSEAQRWYADVYQKWSAVENITEFNVGSFYEVISAARHCRWELSDSEHERLWLTLLKKYIDLDQTIIVCRRKAIYEYIFLTLSPDPKNFQHKGKITDQQELIRYYFNHMGDRNTFSDIEDDIVLLEIIQAQQYFREKFLEDAEIEGWVAGVEQEINVKLGNPSTVDELCKAYELQGHFVFHGNQQIPLIDRTNASIAIYRKIIELLPDTKTYSISTLHDQLTQILENLIVIGGHPAVVKLIEDFCDEIEEQAGKTERNHHSAQNLVKRGKAYLSNPSFENNLNALECFHKAKSLYFLDDTKEGFILGLLVTAQVYSTLKLNFAAKYYGLCALHACFHLGDYKTLKRISDSYAVIFQADFTQGAWISALYTFKKYLHARKEFTTEEVDLEKDEMLRKTLLDVSMLLGSSTKLREDLTAFLNYQKSSFGSPFPEMVDAMASGIISTLEGQGDLYKLLERKLVDIPLNDLGPVREIRFQFYGMQWQIAFPNDAVSNGVAEEFCALLQITLAEIAALGTNPRFNSPIVRINIQVAENYDRSPEFRQENEKLSCDIFIPSTITRTKEEIHDHYGFIGSCINTILRNLSQIREEEFAAMSEDLIKTKKLSEKGLSLSSYQTVYFDLLTSEEFNDARRADFTSNRT
ncbi:dsDNA nuclease domain-containing protein [uncultured Chryseobacterium sp.]|uniref:dsDNA nuclease domain-containing protein n=1 Tax=uncultured Chryseobacterium sp. TaxID=259322 RepID=UPI002582C06D|nr:dsDNA nuclease domain-containing protein [uncultured Chryseobacterium sp.]